MEKKMEMKMKWDGGSDMETSKDIDCYSSDDGSGNIVSIKQKGS